MFEEEVIKKLRNAYLEQKEVYVTGINSYGEEFSTQNAVIGSEISLEYGSVSLINAKGDRTYSTVFETKFNPDNTLIIFTILIDGEIVFKNPNKEMILEKAQKNNNKVEKNLKENNRDFIVDCEVVRSLKQMIGRFVTLDNDFGVVVAVKGCDYYNNPIVYLRRKGYYFDCIVEGESKLFTYDSENHQIEEAVNNTYQFYLRTKSNGDDGVSVNT